MKKRMLSLLLACVLLCGTCSIVSVNAYSATDIAYPVEGGNIYFDKQDGSITDCDVSVTKADIPAEIEGTAVKNIRGASFYGCKKLESVTLPEGLLRIWGSAFYGCSALTTVSIPRTVVYIDSAAFQSCSAMTAIRVDKDNSFYCNDDYGVLFNKKKSTLIYMPDTYAGDYSIPDSVETIESKAFFGCAKLTKVTIPASVTTIKTEIGGWPFYYCRSLQEICVDAANQNYSSDACGFLFNKQKTELICMPGGFCGDYAIPESVTSISKNAFAFRSGLTGITIPAGITQIDVATFSACNALKSVTLPEGLTSIGFGAFQGCRSLTSITIPASVTKLDEKAFHDCMALTSVYFMGDAPEIGWGVFQTCDGTHKNEENIPGLTLYYIDGKAGWTTPLWNGYPTATWKIGHEHSYVETVTAPTCTEKGYTTHICECGDSYVDSYVDVLGHTWDAGSVAKEPTCTDKGYMTYSCTACGESYVEAYHDALGHAWDNGVVTKEPTEKEAGEKTFTCARCKATQTERIPATGEQTDKPCDGGVSCPSKKFVDVNTKEWYHLYVDYAVVHGLFGGTSANTFEPETAMTRAMLVTVLWRYEGQPKGYQNNFSDVNAKDGGWYIDAVAWAAANDVVNGVGNGKFDPDGKITREQMATILYRYAEKKEIDTSKRGDLSGFPDSSKVASWAKDAVQWAVAEKIINGSDGKLLPQGDATRAQVATILMRFIENIVKK